MKKQIPNIKINKKNTLSNGVIWSFIDNIFGSGIIFIIGIILARILNPEEFGLIGIVTIFIAVSTTIVDSGFSNALIRKIDVTDTDYNTVFYFNLIVSIILYIGFWFLSPLIADFFNKEALTLILRVMGIVLFINALAIIHQVILVKKVDFKKQAKISIISSVISGIISVVMALKGCGVWSLVGQQIARQLLTTILMWILDTWRPKLEFSRVSFKELFSFGSKLLASALIDTIYTNVYKFVIGKYYSTVQLGYYTRAVQFQTIFTSNLTRVIQRVSYPVLSNIQNDAEQLFMLYRKIIKTTMMFSFALLFGLGAISEPLIITLVGEKWLPAVPYLQIICLSGALYPLHAINLNMLQVKGRSDLFLKLEIIKKIIAIVPILLGIFYSIEYMLWGGVVTSAIAFLLNSYYSGNLIGYSSARQLKDILPSFVISLVISFAVWLICYFVGSTLSVLLTQIFVGVVATIIFYALIGNKEFIEIKNWFFQKRIKKCQN